jgi:chromosome partitioning protein
MSDVLARPFISMRNDHQDALASGLAVSEYAPGGKSAEEISQLWRWTEARLTGSSLKNEALTEAAAPVRRESSPAQPLAALGDGLTAWDAGL